jgi:hypothetical protein
MLDSATIEKLGCQIPINGVLKYLESSLVEEPEYEQDRRYDSKFEPIHVPHESIIRMLELEFEETPRIRLGTRLN